MVAAARGEEGVREFARNAKLDFPTPLFKVTN